MNSVFYDPSIYGRFLVVAILASVTLVLFARGSVAYAAAAAAAGITVGLLPSFSQSSYFALAVGIAAGLTVLWRRKAILPLVIAAAVLVLVTMGVPQLRHRILGKAGVSHATSGRSTLVSTGGDLFLHHPLIGVGTGGFVAGLREGDAQGRATNPHTAPITVAAETGVIGIAALLWLLWEGLSVPFRRNRGATAGRPRASCLRISLARDRRAQPLLQRADRGPALLGAARPVRRRLPAAGGRARMIGGWKRALVLAPHTDDGEFGCGGTMARLVDEGTDVRYVAFSIATRSLPRASRPTRSATRSRPRPPSSASPPRTSPSTTSTSAPSPSTARRSSSS